MNFADKKGLVPSKKTVTYQFTMEEIIDLVASYVKEQIGLDLTFHITETFDIGISAFSVRLDEIYFDDSYEMTEEQEYKLFEEWDVDLYNCDKIIAEIFDENEDNMDLHYNEYERLYEVIIDK